MRCPNCDRDGDALKYKGSADGSEWVECKCGERGDEDHFSSEPRTPPALVLAMQNCASTMRQSMTREEWAEGARKGYELVCDLTAQIRSRGRFYDYRTY